MAVSIFSSVRVDQLEIAKWALVSLYVLCTAGVVLGVYWEGHKFSPAKQQRGWQILVISLGVEMLLGIAIFATDGWIGQLQRDEIAFLQREVRGREISPQQASSVISVLRGQTVPAFTIIVVPDVEAGRFAISVWELLKAAGVKTEVKFLDREPDATRSIYLPIGMIVCDDGSVDGDRLFKALFEVGIATAGFPIRPPPGFPSQHEAGLPIFCQPNSVFIGRRTPAQEIWFRRG